MTMQRLVVAMTALAASCALVACGSSSSASSSSSSAGSPASTVAGNPANRGAFRACLQAHGVTLPSRPPGNGPPRAGGGLFGGGRAAGGGFRANPKLRAAFQACGGSRLRFRRGAGNFRLSHTAINNFVACVRKHGYKMPSPNFSGKGPVFPASIRTNPKFQSAARSCISLLRPPQSGSASTSPSS